MTKSNDAPAQGAANRKPLFFQQPVALSSRDHADWRLLSGDLAFAANAVSIPVSVSELMVAGRDYPILFAGDQAAPVALVGLKDQNLFVSGGQWDSHCYIPAYVRRYPFATLALGDEPRILLVVDAASDRLVKDGGSSDQGRPLFEAGEPSELTKQLMNFCNQFHHDADNTRLFGQALLESGVLVERRAEIAGPDGKGKSAVTGFRLVDARRLAELPDATVLEWHRKGWLALIHYHLASLQRLAELGRRAQLVDAINPTEMENA